MSVNKFVLNETSYFGKGAREELPEEIRKRGFRKVLVVTDKTLLECGVAGKVIDVFPTGSNDVYTVRNSENKDILLPAIEDVVKDIDIENKKIIVHLLEGLIWELMY